MKKRGKTLTMEQINYAKELLLSSDKYDFYFITEDNELYGAHKIVTPSEKQKHTDETKILTIIGNCDKAIWG